MIEMDWNEVEYRLRWNKRVIRTGQVIGTKFSGHSDQNEMEFITMTKTGLKLFNQIEIDKLIKLG